MKKYCIQLSTGLIFRTEQDFAYTNKGYGADKAGIKSDDPDRPINGWINGETVVKDFWWKQSDVVCHWEE